MSSHFARCNQNDYDESTADDLSTLEKEQISSLFQKFLKSYPDPTLLVDLDGLVVETNCAVEMVLGFPGDLLRGHKLDILIPDRLREIFEKFQSDYLNHPHSCRMHFSVRLLGGREMPVDVVISPVTLGQQQLFLIEARDMTEYNELSRSLQESRDQALDAARSKSAFLANMSHELRTPLNTIIGMIELLRQTQLDEQQEEFATIAGTTAATLISVINEVLDFSKLEAGMVHLELQDFSVADVVASVANMLKSQAQAKGLSFVTCVSDAIPYMVRGDPKRIRQVLINLVHNAVKFTERGEVSVAAELNETHEALTFSVSDSGIGMPPEKQSKLFQPFSQADQSITSQYGGTGLGLSISKRLVELMGGIIGVQSKAGAGSRFWLSIPVQRASSSPEGNSKTANAKIVPLPEPHAKPAGKILLADDNALNRKVAQAYLKRLGYETEAVACGKDAVDAVARNSYATVLMDVQMPGMDGFQATRAIRLQESASGSHVPIIALTAYGLEEYKNECLAAGMDDYLSKPITQEELKKTLERWAA